MEEEKIVTEQPLVDEKPYVDLNRDEFIQFRLLLARVNGPLRMRLATLLMSAICCVVLVALALVEWWRMGQEGYPDPVLLAGALLVLLPGLFLYCYVPKKMKKTAAAQFDRSARAGMHYYGYLQIFTDCIEKVSQFGTAHICLDERVLFIEAPEMMVFSSSSSPALILPARCMTPELAAQVRQAADRLPANHRRFIGRLQPQSLPVTPPPKREDPEQLWVSTFTYRPEEYAAALKGLLMANYWRTAPTLALISMIAALTLTYVEIQLAATIVVFLVLFGLGTLLNLVLPLSRTKRQVYNLSAHDLTMQVRMDTMMLHIKVPKGGEVGVLWCDVNHVYDKDTYVEIVHNKHATLYIPKRVIDDMTVFEAAISRCWSKQ